MPRSICGENWPVLVQLYLQDLKGDISRPGYGWSGAWQTTRAGGVGTVGMVAMVVMLWTLAIGSRNHQAPAAGAT